MKRKNLVLTCLYALTLSLFAVFTMSSCAKDEKEIINTATETTLHVVIKPMDLQTKVVGNNDYQYNETKINSAVIAVFHKDGSVNTVRRAEFAIGAPTKVGKTYYYPIDIPAVRNTHYKYTLTIKGLGTNNPDDNYEESSVLDLKLTVKDWN